VPSGRFVCVGTPSQINGDLDLTIFRRVCQEIGGTQAKTARHTIVIRDTVLRARSRDCHSELEEQSGKRRRRTLGYATIRSFSAKARGVDFQIPAKTIIGEVDVAKRRRGRDLR